MGRNKAIWLLHATDLLRVVLLQHALTGRDNVDKLCDMDVVGSSGADASVPKAHDKHAHSII